MKILPPNLITFTHIFIALFAIAPVLRSQSNDNGFLWGVCGHPQWMEYQDWNTYRYGRQLDYLRQLGCKAYRISFDVHGHPWALDNVVPMAKARDIQILPILPLSITPANGFQANYDTNYANAQTWANHAITNGYHLPYWELGNELENWGLLTISGDGALPSNYTDAVPGATAAIAGALNGAYQGLKDAYSAARSAGTTTITPQCLYGATWRHWGLLHRIKDYNNLNFLPCDIISWHWYTPSFGALTARITTGGSAYRTPVECLNDFKKHEAPTEPMDIWITESGRSENLPGFGFVGGSCTSTVNPAANQNFALQASELSSEISDLKSVPSIKAIFVYELFNSTTTFGTANAAEAYFGLVTALDGTPKNAFWGYQNAVNFHGNLNPHGAVFTLSPSALAEDRAMEVNGGSTGHQAPLAIATTSNPPGSHQQWIITEDGQDANGTSFYKITNLKSFKALGTTAANPGAWTTPSQVDDSGPNAPALAKRRWYVHAISPAGTYAITLRHNPSLYLNLAQASGAGGIRLLTSVRPWRLKDTQSRGPIYCIAARSTGKMATVSGTANDSRVSQQAANGQNAQRWIFRHAGGDSYKIYPLESGRPMKPFGALTTPGAAMQIWDDLAQPNTLWSITSTDGNFYKITNQATGLVLEVNQGSTNDGAFLVQGTWTGATHQQWTISPP